MTDRTRSYSVRLLGAPLVSDAQGNAVRFPTKKCIALLAMVATSTGGLRREDAAATLWSRSPETQARTNLRQALSAIRTTLKDEIILSKGETLALVHELVAIDIDALGSDETYLGEHVSLFGGPFLDGLSIDEAPFEEWLLVKRAEYARLVRDILFDAGSAALDAGDARQALRTAERILALDPFDETGMALCLKAHAKDGERARVQRRFEEFERLLKRELGIEMSPDLVALKAALIKSPNGTDTRMTAINLPRVLISPFRTLSDAADHRYFAEGLAQDIAAQLSKFSTLAVISGHSHAGMEMSGNHHSRASDLGADYVLSGTVRWLDERFRLSVELVEVSNGAVKWADRLDRQSLDLFDLQDDVSRYLVAAIPYRIEENIADKAGKKAVGDLQAYELMILGKHLRDTISLEGNLAARALLEQAVKKDHGIARAHMYLSDTYVVQHWIGHLDPLGKEKALYHARRAVALDPHDVHVQDHLGFALHVMGHWAAAEAQIRQALSMAENEIESLSWCGYALLMLGRHDKAAEIIEAVAQRRTTLPPTFEWILGQLLSFQGRDAEVIQTLNGASLLNSTGFAFRAGSQARLGMIEEAKFTLSEFKEARRREQRLSGMKEDATTIEAALGDFRALWRRSEDWEHIAEGLRLAGLPD